MLKLGLLLSYLRKSELEPGTLDQLYQLSPRDTIGQNVQLFSDQAVRFGQTYSVRQLLELMGSHSDNNAARLLAANLDPAEPARLFKNLDLPDINYNRSNYLLNAFEVSTFLKAIFNGSCLNPDNSEYAASLLSQGHFDDGFAAGFPSDVKMWHKYGEWHDGLGNHELHETAVFFIGDRPYLLTVMSRGKQPQKLAEFLQIIARKTYNNFGA